MENIDVNDFLKRLFAYNKHMNLQLINRLIENPQSNPEYSVKLMNHILNAHSIWCDRIRNKEPSTEVWAIQKKSEWEEINNRNHKKSDAILRDYELRRNISYINSLGDSYNNSVLDILFHIINHSNYHRAQIARDVRQAGIEPIRSDYILYRRES